jgi:hypothetical protein
MYHCFLPRSFEEFDYGKEQGHQYTDHANRTNEEPEPVLILDYWFMLPWQREFEIRRIPTSHVSTSLAAAAYEAAWVSSARESP